MKKAYTALAHTIAVLVVLQAAFMAWAIFGFGKWIDDGNTFDKSVLDCTDCGWNFTEERGFMFHGISGMMLIPLISLILLIIAFFAKIPGGVKYAAVLLVLILIQGQVLPMVGRDMPFFGAVHGANALAILLVAVWAGLRVKRVTGAEAPRASVTV